MARQWLRMQLDVCIKFRLFPLKMVLQITYYKKNTCKKFLMFGSNPENHGATVLVTYGGGNGGGG